MEIAIAIFLGAYLVGIGIISFIRMSKDFEEADKK